MKINNTSSIEDLEIALGKIKENEIAINEQLNNNEREKRLIYLKTYFISAIHDYIICIKLSNNEKYIKTFFEDMMKNLTLLSLWTINDDYYSVEIKGNNVNVIGCNSKLIETNQLLSIINGNVNCLPIEIMEVNVYLRNCKINFTNI